MKFTVIERRQHTPNNSQAYLTWDNWDDYGYRTQYGLKYVDEAGIGHYIGSVKIGFSGQTVLDYRAVEWQATFEQLPDTHFSLGTSEEYYENLNALGPQLRDEILKALNDIARFQEFYDLAISENVTQTSLLRFISPTTVEGQYHRMSLGGAKLTPYHFSFISPKRSNSSPFELSFQVIPESYPPTNIHVLIGRNGVGKTHLLNNMIKSLISEKSGLYGEFVQNEDDESPFPTSNESFANLVWVSFSAFDETEPLPERKDTSEGIRYYYIGLKRIQTGEKKNRSPKSTYMLREEFLKSLNACKNHVKKDRWINAISSLESDTNFRDSRVKDLINIEDENEYKAEGEKIFKRLSSGHKIIILTITRLIETVQEKTLVLIDEPEAHLHPPLLSAFIRTLSDLMIKTNGVSIIATHSPVILQEVPKGCVWKLRRSGAETVAERPLIESFGENVGILTREVFGLEVTDSGFYKLLAEVAKDMSYDQVIQYFGGELGMEAKAILRVLTTNQNN